jgi:hypothetical protein
VAFLASPPTHPPNWRGFLCLTPNPLSKLERGLQGA